MNRARSSGSGEARLLWLLALWIAVVGVCAAAWFYSNLIVWSVVAPLVACTLIVVAFLGYLRRIEGTISYFEIGIFCVLITYLYCAYPLARYILGGYTFPEWGDPRLFVMRLRPDDLGVLAWWYVAYLFFLCIGYALSRGRAALRAPVRVAPADVPTLLTIALLLIGTKLFFFVLGWFFDLHTTSYLDEYLVFQRLPLVLRQIAMHVQGVALTLQMMLVIALYSARRMRYQVILAGVLLFTIITRLLWPGARVELFAVILSVVAVFDLTTRRIPLRWMLVGAAAGFVVLLAMSALRDDRRSGRLDLTAQVTEFEIIFGNALDLKYLKEVSGGFIDQPGLYWSGLFALIPQEFLPMEKDIPANWYGREFYRDYFESGGGLAFGVLAEAVMGYGAVEVVWRGLLVGVLFGLLHRRLMRGEVSLSFIMFYVWIVVWSYQSIRNGTFGLLVLILYHFLAPLLAIFVLSEVLRRGRRAARRLIPIGSPKFA